MRPRLERPRPRRARRGPSRRPWVEALEPRSLLAASLSVGPVQNASHLVHNQAQPTIAVNPLNPLNEVVFSDAVDDAGIFRGYTLDGGKTWTSGYVADGVADSLPKAFGSVSAAFDLFGDLIVSYAKSDLSATIVAVSTDGGSTLQQVGSLDQLGSNPQLVIGPGGTSAPQAVWIQGQNGSNSDVELVGAPINGKGQVGPFLAPEFVSGSTGDAWGAPSVGPNGQVMLVYQDPAGGAGPSDLWVAVDADGLGAGGLAAPMDVTTVNIGGSTLVTPQPVAKITDCDGLAYDDSNGPHRGRVYLVKTDTEPLGNPNTAIFVEYSDDDGKTWSTDVDADDSGGNSSLLLPRIAVDPTTGAVGVTWLDARNDSKDITVEEFGTVSTDGGQSFLKNVQIASGPSDAITATGFAGGDDSGFDFGQYTGLVYNNNVMYPAWPDNSPGLAGNPDPKNFDIATAQVSVTGPTAATPFPLTGVPFTGALGQSATGTVATFALPQPGASANQFYASIDWGDGTFSTGTVSNAPGSGFQVTGTHTYTKLGNETIQVVVVEQNNSLSSTTTTTASVSGLALVPSSVTFTASEGATFSGTVATFIDPNDVPSPLSTYQASIDWGDGTQSAGVVTAGPKSVYEVQGSHVFSAGTHTVKVTVSEGGALPVTVSSTATVADTAIDALGTTGTAVEGTPFVGSVATFVDHDPRVHGADYYSATIDWGDGTTSGGSVSSIGPGKFSVSGNHVYHIGNYTPQVTIHDGDVTQVSTSSSVAVSDAPITPQGTTFSTSEGDAFSGLIATFHDEDTTSRAATFQAQVDWGDGTSSSAVIAWDGGGDFAVVGSHAYTQGTHTVQIRVSEVGQPQIQFAMSSTAVISDAPLAGSPAAALTGVEGHPVSGTLATFTDPDTQASPATFSATIGWGDGTTGTGTIVQNADGSFSVSGTHLYALSGTFAPTVLVRDSGGAETSIATPVTINDAPLSAQGVPLTMTAGQDFQGVVATFLDTNPDGSPNENSASIDWGDGTVTPGSVTQESNGGFSVAGEHIYGTGGPYTVTVTITATGGSSVTATSAVNVSERQTPLSGQLSAQSDSGASATDGVTNISQPTFQGLAAANATVQVFAVSAGTTPLVLVGHGPSDALGNWSVTTVPLPDGTYSIFVQATNAAGRLVSPLTQLMPAAGHGPLTITHAGSHITGSSLDPNTAQVQITVQDLLAGLDPAVLSNPLNYSLTVLTARGSRPVPISGIAVGPVSPSDNVTVTLTFGGGAPLRRGTYVLAVSGAGVVDIAGNPLATTDFAPSPVLAPAPGTAYMAEFPVGSGSGTGRRGHLSPHPFVPPGQRRGASRFGQFLRSHGRLRIR
jgi:hypothetical protein